MSAYHVRAHRGTALRRRTRLLRIIVYIAAAVLAYNLVAALCRGSFLGESSLPGETSPELDVWEDEPEYWDIVVAIIVSTVQNDNHLWILVALEGSGWAFVPVLLDTTAGDMVLLSGRGREAMAYLQYIIDQYEGLYAVSVFVKSSQYEWYHDDPLYDQATVLKNLNIDNVKKKGFVNLRCTWYVGCPLQIQPKSALKSATQEKTKKVGEEKEKEKKSFDYLYATEWTKLFPKQSLPEKVAASCCSTFAVSRERIRARPKSDYIRYRDWLMDTPLDEDTAIAIMEYSWHIIFGMPSVHCPPPEKCYCDTFGYCNTVGCTESNCDSRYKIPPYSTLPKGWPRVGWDS